MQLAFHSPLRDFNHPLMQVYLYYEIQDQIRSYPQMCVLHESCNRLVRPRPEKSDDEGFSFCSKLVLQNSLISFTE